MKTTSFFMMVVLLMLLAGCSTVQVSQDYDTELGIPELTTYSWKEREGEAADDARDKNPLLDKRFQKAISLELQRMGYMPAPSADFLVRYSYTVTTRLESEPVSVGFGYGLGRHGRYGGIGFNTGTEIRQYHVGILVIDFFDPVSGDLIWRGRGSEIVSKHPSPQESNEMASRLTKAILGQFPPQ